MTGLIRSGGEIRVAASVTGDGYNGDGTLAFVVDDGLIQRLTITA